MKKSFNKKVIMSALAITVGAAASASAVDNAIKDPLFSLKEINSQSILIAHGGEGKCGEGKCGGKKEEATTKAKSAEAKCGEGKCGGKKGHKAKKEAKTKAKSAEAKCGEGKCGADKKGTEAKCGEGKCGADKKKTN